MAKIPDKIKMYGHSACPQVPPMLAMLKRVGVEYDYINIHKDEAARKLVCSINNGYESVPTFVFPDGSILTEPNAWQITQKLEALNYHVPLTAKLIGSTSMFPILITFGVVVWVIIQFIIDAL